MQDAVGIAESGDGGARDGFGGGDVCCVGREGGVHLDEGAENDALIVGPHRAAVVLAGGEVEAVVDGIVSVDHAGCAEPGPGFLRPIEVVGFSVGRGAVGEVGGDGDEEFVFNGAVCLVLLVPP